MPGFVLGQTLVIIAWVISNTWRGLPHFDPYPFIFMNLVFSALSAYAAPFILLSETRQADRDRQRTAEDVRHHDQIERHHQQSLEQNSAQTEEIARLFSGYVARLEQLGQSLEEIKALLERGSQEAERSLGSSSTTRESAPAAHQRSTGVRACMNSDVTRADDADNAPRLCAKAPRAPGHHERDPSAARKRARSASLAAV
ncbi:DUF1003 domain-containing protein [Gryllotalpicola reticulitermitis]|uniref:DUF1003 domain-containing protein n=1 Tax=Gryllotalpicola reticulitermitis TaxID=1184153 RepID=A0ABV8Q3F0_9MICO